ncbi:MAG: anti-sigma factor antagonist [Lachnospiraceae bacterium]|nr:anti-sigma factor antagonist [Lachnospiraceae bacterium]
MKITEENGCITLCLSGRIDASNAAQVESEIFNGLHNTTAEEIVLDAEELTYISSAGLRVLLKAKKSFPQPLRVTNVSRDVYDIFEMTGFKDMLHVSKAYRKLSVDGCEVIGKGFFGTVYRIDPETILKVYHGRDSIPMIQNEQRMAKKAFAAGIPTAISFDIVQVGEDYGSVFELLNAKTFNDLVVENSMPLEEIVKQYTDLIRLVHETEMEPGDLPSVRDRFVEYLEVIEEYLTEEQKQALSKMLSALPDVTTVTHGDFQMKNVMLVSGEPMLIDMDTMGFGQPIFDLQALYVTYRMFEEDEPGNAMSFLGMSSETAERIWELVLANYFSSATAEELTQKENKIRLVACLRFLFLLATTDLKSGDLGQKRIRHTKEHIADLLLQVGDLDL